MAAGDVVNSVSGTAGVNLIFQPAAGVEVMITGMFGSGFVYYGLLSAAIPATGQVLIVRDSIFSNTHNMKIGINNNVYWKGYGTIVQHGYTGIQIK